MTIAAVLIATCSVVLSLMSVRYTRQAAKSRAELEQIRADRAGHS